MKKILSILIGVFVGVTTALAGGTITMNVSVSGPEGSGSAEVCGWDYNKVWEGWSQVWKKQATECGTTDIKSYGEYEDNLISSDFFQNAEADLKAEVLLSGCKFVGWTHEATNSIVPIYAATDPDAFVDFGERSQQNSGTVNFTAHFDYMYSCLHKAQAVALAYQDLPVGMVSVDMGAKKELNNVTLWSDPTSTNDYLYAEEGVSTKGVKWSFNYYAKTIDFSSVEGMEGMKFVFDGWYADEEGTQLISKDNPYTHTVEANYDDPDGTVYDPSTKPLYAKFRFDAYYYYKGATAGFALNGEKVGKITVAATVSDASTDEATTSTYTASTKNDMIQDDNIYKVLPKSSVDYSYTYTISEIPDDAKATFMGWSASPYGGTYLQHEPSSQYIGEYTTYSLDKDPEVASPTPPVYAVFLSYWYKDPTVLLTTSSQGLGTVTATYSEEVPEEGWSTGQVGTTIHQEKIDLDNPDGFTYDVYYHAKNEHGSYFKGWAKVNNPNKLIADNSVNPYHERYKVTSTDKNSPFTSPTVYAVFESDIAILQQDRMICYQNVDGVTNINDAKVIINFNKANTITAKLKGEWADYFILSDKAQTDRDSEVVLNTSEGLVTLMVSYRKDKPLDQAIGKVAEIELSTNYEGKDVTRDLLIAVETVPVVTFLPTDGKGAYIIKHTDGSGIEYEMPLNETENVDISVTQESLSTIEMSINDNTEDDYHFYGWHLTTPSGDEFISYDEKCTYAFSEPSIVRPVFTTSDVAVFTILGDPSETQYDDLQKAIDDAAAMGGKQVVVFSNNGNPMGTLAQGNYVIKPNVTLLIPGVGPGDDVTMPSEADENKYIYRLKHDGVVAGTSIATEIALTTNDYFDDEVTSATAPAKCFRKLIVSDNTTITVEGGANLYLYSLINRFNQAYDARPHRYGQIVLGENSRINVSSGASLYAFGYITGAQSSRVIANSGAEVHEIFQYSDPRGGSGVAHLFLYRKQYKVFPFSQYYVQNIEIPLELKSGSVEYITTSADVLNPYVIMTKFVIPHSGEGITSSTSGLFRLDKNASLIKYYDPITDRQKFIIKGDGVNPAQARLGRIHIQMGDVSGAVGDMIGSDILGWLAGAFMSDLKNVQLNSKEYVLPMNHNMDVHLENVNMTITSDFAFLAGSTLTIDEKSSLVVNTATNVYVYDADENRLPDAGENYGKGYGYCGNENYVLEQIVSTPNNTQLLSDNTTYKRQPQDVKDSKWVVNGKIIVNEGAGFYTTAGGAQIISTGNGQVQFNQSLGNATTYQAKYIGGGGTALLDEEGIHNKVPFTVNSAKLQNADNSYVHTVASIYTYNPAQGKWVTDATSVALEGGTIIVTQPGEAEVGIVKSTIADAASATIAANNGIATVSTPTYQEGKLCLSVEYAPSNVAGEYEGIITIKNSASTAIATQRVLLIEDYTPRFTTLDAWDAQAYLGYSSEVFANIVPQAENVAGILSGQYASTWDYEITGEHADEFTLVWGEGENKLSGAKIVFKPKTSGNKTALLSLTCSYTDAAKVVHTTTKTIPLTATVQSLQANPLAFADGVESIFSSSDAQQLFKNTYSEAPITITPATNDVVTIEIIDGQYKIAPKALGSVTITAIQEADLENGYAATTITKTITVTDDVVWNWERLYFGSENISPVTTKYNEWKLTIAEIVDTDNDGQPDKDDEENVIIANPHPGVLDLDETAIGDYKATLANWEEGETYVWFAFNYLDGEDEKIKYFKSEIYRDPRFLSISVNDDYIYEAVTNSFDKITYNNGSVTFNSSDNQISTWTFGFKGIPDLLSFTVEGKNNWQIEESPNGTNWSIAYTWAPISEGVPFELALQPATQYVRISYATGTNPEGVISNISVSELKTVRADVDKLYMPLIDGGVTKNVVFTYVSADGYDLSTSHNFFTTDLDHNKLPGLSVDPFYVVKRVGVNSVATEEILGSLKVDNTETNIPIQTFEYPQSIPVQLASDHLERFFYVTSEAYKTSWNADKRTVVMNNAVADASPYVVFHFAEAPVPGVISFNFPTTAHGTWEVMESADATAWNPLLPNSTQNIGNGFVMQDFQHPTTSRYVRVKYVSDYAEVVELTNLSILPTTSVTVNPYELEVYDDKNEKVTVTANNLKQVSFKISEGFQIVNESGNPTNFESTFTAGGTISSDIYIDYTGDASATYGELTITTTMDAEGNPIAEKVLATVKLTGLKRNLPNGATGIKTGVPNDYTIKGYDKENNYAEAKYRDVVTTNAFADNKALFDYVIIYGETTTSDESKTITSPTSTAGSNAKTPCYIYQKNGEDYQLISVVENANSSTKSWKGALQTNGGSLKVYITGFCPYASTGYTKADEGVWYFQGAENENIDIYLEDCYIYSRYKSKRGNSFSRSNGETFSDKVARGSGAVLLFANTAESNTKPLNVTIHTRGKNLLKSHYGCLYESIVGRAFQISSPVHVYMQSEAHYKNSYTELNFTDEWPISGGTERTNGCLSLQKQVNNAPSIDMGNKNTVVNFRGGQVELQNALNSSDNYESTLAISYRTGIYGPEKFKFTLAHGIGTDGVEGRVNFYDGTTTVKSMEVPERYRQYYLMDGENEELSTTSCLRSQKYTFVYGGSHCMMRACSEPTSKGGAPTDGNIVGGEATGNPLGLYQYPQSEGWTANGSYGLVTPTKFPGELQKDGNKLSALHATYPEGKYGVSSITPAAGNYLNLWVPGGYGVGKQPEVDQKISYWKACMTHIEASYGVYGGEIGGMTTIGTDAEGAQTELVYNLLYCEIDDNISEVIRSATYSAPVLNPAPTQTEAEKYEMEITAENLTVTDELQNYITNAKPYKVQSRVYYIVPAKADVWMNFTAPFNVENVYVMETFDERILSNTKTNTRAEQLELQANHNADFAAFFGVALALDSKKPFWEIYNDYMGWAKYWDKKEGRWNGTSPYTLRGKYKLRHYYQKTEKDPVTGKDITTSNWNSSDYVLYKNNGPWEWDASYNEGEGRYIAKWDFVVPNEEEPLMKQGQTYSMQFPYCTGCWDESNERDFWDYWTGKFLIFESTDGGAEGHTIQGSEFVGSTYVPEELIFTYKADETFLADKGVASGQALLLGNSTFALMGTKNPNVYYYNFEDNNEYWEVNQDYDDINEVYVNKTEFTEVNPTSALLLSASTILSNGYTAIKIGRDGAITYGPKNNGNPGDGTTTGTNTPTVGGGNDMFITGIAGGINIAVAAPQMVCVVNATGHIIYSGYVADNVDVLLPMNGIYVVKGENEAQKIFF